MSLDLQGVGLQAGAAVRRPTAAHRHRAGLGETAATGAAGRAAGQPRLQATRGAARLFAESGAILVYATTEPTEALLLGGTTIALAEGRVVQAGPAVSVYRQPQTIEAARAFSDPPLNELAFDKRGATLLLGRGDQVPAPGPLLGLTDGAYRLGFRSDDVTIGPHQDALTVRGTVAVTEINGLESFVHVATPYGTWVCLMPGVHDLPVGETVDLGIDAAQAFVFGPGGHCVTPHRLLETV